MECSENYKTIKIQELRRPTQPRGKNTAPQMIYYQYDNSDTIVFYFSTLRRANGFRECLQHRVYPQETNYYVSIKELDILVGVEIRLHTNVQSSIISIECRCRQRYTAINLIAELDKYMFYNSSWTVFKRNDSDDVFFISD